MGAVCHQWHMVGVGVHGGAWLELKYKVHDVLNLKNLNKVTWELAPHGVPQKGSRQVAAPFGPGFPFFH